ncbi:uncharacterized protein LOC118200274 isoform X1 [Stegodyphus dumicola]|uniref:uncharacterized protein LOC118200274 isoform X1 n=1 Tax=Stegodyphus dumicola TaxID=202533 RepID=UPI0015B32B46|nr:uncharacterized protein LOC118200274 isoform X1 [Stegodyphus dumicola]XP_035228111.1 uncharacterized protein LOC118200274 isoform X1 [Stegodyphus dumicola]
MFQNYNLPAFPDGSFTNLKNLDKFHLKIVDGSKIQLLSAQIPGYSVFENLTAKSIIFDIIDVPILVGWKWNVLENLNPSGQEGMQFNAVRSKLLYLHSDFRKIAKNNVIAIRILKCQLKWIGEGAFATFSSLRILELRDNLIESIDRSHLPVNAAYLRVLDLGKNRLAHISEDLFQGLPIAHVYLDGNNILAIEIEKLRKLNKISVSIIMNEPNLTMKNITDQESEVAPSRDVD